MGSRYDVFLCHNHVDKPAVEELAERLRAAGLEPWLDKSDLRRGVQWTEVVEKCLVEESASCAVMIGPSGLGPWQKRELSLALDRQVEAGSKGETFPVIPVLLPGGAFETLPGFLKGHTCVSFPKSLDDKDAVDELVRAIRGLPPLRSQPAGGECPYRGLQYFDVAHAAYFNGREKLTALLVEKLRPQAQVKSPSRFLAIVGASGSGKSSLARAGLVAALNRGVIEGSEQWPVVICRPGSEPCANLAVELAKSGSLGPDKQAAKDHLKERMLAEPQALHESVQLSLPSDSPQRRLVLLVDQFEELFTICRDEKQRQAFVDNLVHASHVAQGQTLVLLSLRADFYGKCAAYSNLARALSECQELIGPMTRDELRDAIEKPAQKAACELEPGLSERLSEEVLNEPGSLPFLQFALKELWKRRTGRRLTIDAYHAIGGVPGALQRKANEVYDGLGPEQQTICRRIFLRLTQPGEGTEDTKRRVPISELQPEAGSPAEVEGVLLSLSESETRLVTGELKDGERFFEVAHEALIRGWPRLRGWIDADRTALLTQRRLMEAANQWKTHHGDASFLYTGARLAAAREWAAAHAEEINPLESEFIKASRRHARGQRLKVISALALVLAAGFAGVVWKWREALDNAAAAMVARNDAERERKEAQAARETAVAALDRSDRKVYAYHISEAQRDWERNHVEDAEEQLDLCRWDLRGWEHDYLWTLFNTNRRTLQGHRFNVRAVAFSPDGKRIVSGSNDNTLKIWERETGRVVLTLRGHTGSVLSVKFSPDGKQVASGSWDKTVKIWDASSGHELLTLAGHTGGIQCVAYSPDGSRIATAGVDKTLRLWNATTGKTLDTVLAHQGTIRSVVFSPDGKQIASGSEDKTVKIWDMVGGRPVRTLTEHEDWVDCVAFSPDGRWIAGAGGDALLRVWDAASGRPLFAAKGHKAPIPAVAFNPEGDRIVTGSDDNTLKVWNATTGDCLFTLQGHTDWVNGVAFSPDGQCIASASGDATVMLWDMPPASQVPTLRAGSFPVVGFALPREANQLQSVDSQGSLIAWGSKVERRQLDRKGTEVVEHAAFSPDGQSVAIATSEKTFKLWDVVHQKVLVSLAGLTSAVSSVAFGPDSRVVAIGSQTGAVTLYDVTTRRDLWARTVPASSVTSVAFNTDGKQIVTGSADGSVKIWDAGAGQQLATFKAHAGSVQAVALTGDGKRIVTGGDDKTLKIWTTATAQELLTLRGHDGPVTSVALSLDGTRIVSGAVDQTVRVWDAWTGQQMLILRGHKGAVSRVAFTEDGKRIISGSHDGTLKIWEATISQTVLTLRGHTAKVASLAFSPDGKWLASGSSDKTIKVWDVTTGQESLTLKGHTGMVNCVAASPDGKRIASGSEDGTIKVWNAATGQQVLAEAKLASAVKSVAFSPDGRQLASGNYDKTIRIWEIPTEVEDGKTMSGSEVRTLTGHSEPVTSVVFSPLRKSIASGSRDDTVKIWDVSTGQIVRTLNGHTDDVRSVAFSPDGHAVASGSNDRTVKVWDVSTGQPQTTFKGHDGNVSSVAFSPDGLRLASGSSDRTIKVWGLSSGKELLALKGQHSTVWSVAYSPDGKRIASGDTNGTIKIWNLADQPSETAASGSTIAAGKGTLSLQQLIARWSDFDPRETPAAKELSRLARQRTLAEVSERDKSWFAAAFHLDYLIAAQPEALDLRFRRANALLGAGRYREARIDIDLVLAKEPKNVNARQVSAWDFWTSREYQRALSEIAFVLEKDPQNADALFLRGTCRAELGQFGDAVKDFEIANQRAAAPRKLSCLAAAFLASGDESAFRQTCQKLFDKYSSPKTPDRELVLMAVAILPAATSDWAPDVKLGQELCNQHPDELRYPILLGAILFRAGRFSEADQQFQKVVERHGNDWIIDLFFSMTLGRLGRFSEAVECLAQATQKFESAPNPDWVGRLQYRLLRAEAQGLLPLVAPRPAHPPATASPAGVTHP